MKLFNSSSETPRHLFNFRKWKSLFETIYNFSHKSIIDDNQLPEE